MSKNICKNLNYKGIICIEFFIDSDDNIVNEVPRT